MYRHYQMPADYSLEDARSLIRQAMAAAAELRRDADTLPSVSADGSSDCPVAETLYFEKEKTAQFVRDDLRTMRRFLRSCTCHIAFAQNKIHELAHEREALHGTEAQDRFAEAELRITDEIRRHQQIRRDLMDAIAEVEATLREAGTKQFPGGDPQGPFGQRTHSPPRSPQSFDKLTKDDATGEIRRLLRPTKGL